MHFSFWLFYFVKLFFNWFYLDFWIWTYNTWLDSRIDPWEEYYLLFALPHVANELARSWKKGCKNLTFSSWFGIYLFLGHARNIGWTLKIIHLQWISCGLSCLKLFATFGTFFFSHFNWFVVGRVVFCFLLKHTSIAWHNVTFMANNSYLSQTILWVDLQSCSFIAFWDFCWAFHLYHTILVYLTKISASSIDLTNCWNYSLINWPDFKMPIAFSLNISIAAVWCILFYCRQSHWIFCVWVTSWKPMLIKSCSYIIIHFL